jgi:hypothetical protein
MPNVRLGSVVAKTVGGGTPERNNLNFWNGGIPWASVKDFKDNNYKLSSTKEEISEKGFKFSASNLIPAGTPIVCTRMAVGRIARADVPVAINQDLRALYINDHFDTAYVVLAIDSIRSQIENLAIGSTVKGINISQALAEINVMAEKHLHDERLSMKGIPPKLRGITDAYLESKGIDVKIKPISILDADFEKQVGKRGRTKTKAAEVEHAIRHHLDVELDDDPELQASFAKALAAIFEEFRENWNRIYEELEKLRTRIMKAAKEPTYGLHRKKHMPLFGMFKREVFGDIFEGGGTEPAEGSFGIADKMTAEDKISRLVDLTWKTFLAVERELKLTGFWESIPARNKLRADLQGVLLAPEFSKLPGLVKNRAHIISRVMEIAEKNNDIILYAE